MWDRGGDELDKGCSVVNLQEFGQWAFPAGHLLVMPTLLKKGFPSSPLANSDSPFNAHVTCPPPLGSLSWFPLQSKSLSRGFPRPSSLLSSLNSVTGLYVSLSHQAGLSFGEK